VQLPGIMSAIDCADLLHPRVCCVLASAELVVHDLQPRSTIAAADLLPGVGDVV
jgi:hypothetical protein